MRVRGQLGCSSTDGGLDHLRHHPRRWVEVRVVDDSQRRGAGVLVAGEAVVQHRLGPIDDRDSDSFAAPRHLGTSAADEVDGLNLAAAQRSKPHLAVGGEGATDCVGCRFDLVDEQRRCRQFARKEMHVHPLGEGEWEVAQRSCPTGESNVPLRQRLPSGVVPQLD